IINSAQQVGGSIGTALLNTIAATATTTYLVGKDAGSRLVQNTAAVHGYTVATTVALGVLVFAAVLGFVMGGHRPKPGQGAGDGRGEGPRGGRGAAGPSRKTPGLRTVSPGAGTSPAMNPSDMMMSVHRGSTDRPPVGGFSRGSQSRIIAFPPRRAIVVR